MPNGKVCTGFSKPYVALYNANAGVVTYSGAKPLARGVSVEISPDASNDNKFYADNVEAESASGVFTGGTVTVTVDGLFISAEKMIMGLPDAEADGFTPYGDNQKAPDMGFGYIARYMSGGVTTFVPTVLAKVKFNQPSSTANTQEEEIDWQTQELKAAIMRGEDANHNWKYVGAEYSTEDEAEAALKTKLGLVLYSVTQTLSNVSSSFTRESIEKGETLEAALTAADGYAFDSVTVTMGGNDITSEVYDSTAHAISIEGVNGEVAITATAVLLTGAVAVTSDFDMDNVSAYYQYVDATGEGNTGSMNGTAVTARSGSTVTMVFSVENTGSISVYLGSATGSPLFTESDVAHVSFDTPGTAGFNGTVTFTTDESDWKKITMVMGGDFAGMTASDFTIESV